MHTWGRFAYKEIFMAGKDFKTIDEQIEILRSRGLTIEDETEAKDFLFRNNYYRISGYSLTLRKNDDLPHSGILKISTTLTTSSDISFCIILKPLKGR